MKHIILGTAGHVDHGKTELTKALTGIDTDCLPEEKKRGLTIEPGFACIALNDQLILDIIDVPGHERFIKNMLAGVAGIDMVMPVIAADEAIMPQTREHLHIIELLGIEKGVVVLSKCDLVDEEWLDVVEEEVKEYLSATSLSNAPIIRVSAKTGMGLSILKKALAELAGTVSCRSVGGMSRLPLDRVFIKQGFGTVVTGTLFSGVIRQGDELQVLPGFATARVRGMQIHGQDTDIAVAGQRVALNLASIDHSWLKRGCWLAQPGLLRESFRLDVEISLLKDAKKLVRLSRLRIHHGTMEVLGRIELLDRQELFGSEKCFAQLIMEKPLFPLKGDILILRSYSPSFTIGRAVVIDIMAKKHKRNCRECLQSLAKLASDDLASLLLESLADTDMFLSVATLSMRLNRSEQELQLELDRLILLGDLTVLGIEGMMYYGLHHREKALLEQLLVCCEEYHRCFNLRRGLPAAEFYSRFCLGLGQKMVTALLGKWQNEAAIIYSSGMIAAPDFVIRENHQQVEWHKLIIEDFVQGGYSPPLWQDVCIKHNISAADAKEMQLFLIDRGELIKAGAGLIFCADVIEEALKILRDQTADSGFALAEARDILCSSRKYVLAILEYADGQKLTSLCGDKRFFN